jgi:PBP1b-binding outer membrane lipoprotein LpoB
MRTLLGLLLALALLLTGCGSDDDPGDRASDPPASSPAEASEPELLILVSQSAVGGEVDPVAVSLDGQAAIDEFGDRFEDGRMGAALTDALAEVRIPGGQVPAAAVVAVGCTPPTDVDIEVTDAGVEVTAPPVKGDVQCLVPVTTVAVIAADPGDL